MLVSVYRWAGIFVGGGGGGGHVERDCLFGMGGCMDLGLGQGR